MEMHYIYIHILKHAGACKVAECMKALAATLTT